MWRTSCLLWKRWFSLIPLIFPWKLSASFSCLIIHLLFSLFVFRSPGHDFSTCWRSYLLVVTPTRKKKERQWNERNSPLSSSLAGNESKSSPNHCWTAHTNVPYHTKGFWVCARMCPEREMTFCIQDGCLSCLLSDLIKQGKEEMEKKYRVKRVRGRKSFFLRRNQEKGKRVVCVLILSCVQGSFACFQLVSCVCMDWIGEWGCLLFSVAAVSSGKSRSQSVSLGVGDWLCECLIVSIERKEKEEGLCCLYLIM